VARDRLFRFRLELQGFLRRNAGLAQGGYRSPPSSGSNSWIGVAGMIVEIACL
jgi:hypothetical protein